MDSNLEFLVGWNSEFPLDRWWRKKYNVPFNSKSHRSISPQDMLLDFIEDSFYKKVGEDLKKGEDEEGYIPGEKNFLRDQIPDDKSFEDFDFSNIKL